MTEYKDYNFRQYYDMSKKTLYNSLINSYYYGMEKKLFTTYFIKGVNKGIIPLSKFAGKKAASIIRYKGHYGHLMGIQV